MALEIKNILSKGCTTFNERTMNWLVKLKEEVGGCLWRAPQILPKNQISFLGISIYFLSRDSIYYSSNLYFYCDYSFFYIETDETL